MTFFVIIAFIVAGCAIYPLPIYIAGYRRVDCFWTVMFINMLLGGTLMGWFFALNLAMFSPSGRPRPGAFYPDDLYEPYDLSTAPPVHTETERETRERRNYEAMFPPEERGYPTHPGRREPHF
jgi:hypothetical protein